MPYLINIKKVFIIIKTIIIKIIIVINNKRYYFLNKKIQISQWAIFNFRQEGVVQVCVL